ncbi:radical SAM/SPASM domain-containing protein [Candidatus Clostridium radicumherbarum]|uniref:Radical SAM/SPASM domain-containing protein n=1 Tax=Candidatus Clostridium radicumherbarum TaxID=3381662 RepID=A0ABW8TN89_9CLOT
MKKFKKIYIEITNVCNLSCDFCPVTKRKPEFMSLETFEKILIDIKPYSDFIYLHVKGEPLLHPKIDEFLEISEAYGFKVNLTTNGTLIDKVICKIINKKALRQINFSLHSFDANETDFTLESYLNSIISFTLEAVKNNIIVSYRLWNLDEDIKSLEKNRHILNIIETAFDLNYKIEEKLMESRGVKLLENVYLNAASRFNWPQKDLVRSDTTGFCYGLRDQTAILVDGTVIPCCLDGEGVINLGNIHITSFKDIIEGSRAAALYESFSNRHVIEDLCKNCDYRRRFNN